MFEASIYFPCVYFKQLPILLIAVIKTACFDLIMFISQI